MKKISINNIIAFKRKSENSRITFINNIKQPKKDKSSGGGDYWVTSTSAISNYYKREDNPLITDMIVELEKRHNKATAKISKDMFQRNKDILHNFEDFDFSSFKPAYELTYLAKPQDKSILKIKGISIQVKPHHVFTYTENDIKQIGAIWFVSKLEGFSIEEIGVFTDALYRYLDMNYSNDFEISHDYCLTLDIVSLKEVRYSQIANNEVSSSLNSILESIQKLL